MNNDKSVLARIREIADENRLIMLCFTKNDAEGAANDFQPANEVEDFELTNDQWNTVVRNWDKQNSAIVEDCWNLLKSLVREAVNNE